MTYKQRIAIINKYKEQLKKDFLLNDDAGIYVFTRHENGFKYAYVGQAKHILTRVVQHIMNYDQHIDKSLKKHKLYSSDNRNGWFITGVNCDESKLNELEQKGIKSYANNGFQMLNKTSGSQGSEKFGITQNKESKGYRQGVAYGELKTKKVIKQFFDKYLDFVIKPKSNKIKERKFEEFKEFLGGTDEN